jgi:hypothetical protein
MHAYIRKAAIGLAAIGAMLGFVGMASASTTPAELSCTLALPPGGDAGDETYTLSLATDVDCFAGNDTNQIDENFSLFGKTGWILADKTDDTTSGDGKAFLSVSGIGGTSPTWTIDPNAFKFDHLVITLKQAGGFGAFLVSGLSGTWSTFKNTGGGSVNDLSHASLYYKGATPIPLPLGAWLALTAAGGLVVLRRRKAAVAA